MISRKRLTDILRYFRSNPGIFCFFAFQSTLLLSTIIYFQNEAIASELIVLGFPIAILGFLIQIVVAMKEKRNFMVNSEKKIRRMNKREVIVDYSLLFLVSLLLIVVWFHDGLLIGGGDEVPWFYAPSTHLASRKYVWINLYEPSFYDIPGLPFIPSLYLLSFLQNLGAAYWVIQATTFFLLMLTSAIAMYNLTWTALPNNEKSRVAAIFSALFYILNSYTMSSVWHRGIVGIMFTMPLLPTVLFILFKYNNRKSAISLGLCISLILLLFTPAFMHTPDVISVWLIIFTYLFFDALFKSKIKRGVTRASEIVVFSLGLWIVFSAWWTLPTIAEFLEPFNWAVGKEVFQWGPFPLSDVVRLFHWSYRLEEPFYPVYISPLFVVISFMIPLTVFLSVMFKPKDKNVLYFVGLSLLGIFLAKGTSPPFGEEIGQLIGSSPLWIFFKLIRDSYTKVGSLISLGYSYLFGVSLNSIYNLRTKISPANIIKPISKFNLRKGTAVALVLISAIPVLVIYSWPMWTGDVWFSNMLTGDGRMTRATIDPPPYYNEAKLWLETQPRGRVIALPTSFGGITFSWPHPFGGHDYRPLFFGRSTTDGTMAKYEGNRMTELLATNIQRNYAWKLMNLFGARYIVVNKDVNAKARPEMKTPKEIETALQYFLIPGGEGGYAYSSLLPNDFRAVWGTDISIENATVDGFQCVRFNANPQGEQRAVGQVFIIKEGLKNFSSLNFLSLWIKSTATGKLFISAVDKSGLGISWDGRYQTEYSVSEREVGKWKQIVLDVHAPTGGVMPSELWEIMIGMLDIKSSDPVSIWVRSIELTPGSKKNNPYIASIASFENLTFYKIEDEYFVDNIYTADKIIGIEHQADIFEYLKIDNVTVGGTVFLRSSDLAPLNKTGGQEIAFLRPSIKFTEINPSEYNVNVENATQPFFLVLSEGYHPKWEVHINDITISSDYHFLANGYANAWYIDRVGSYTITLKFTLEKTLELGFIVSMISLVITSASYTGILLYKRRRTQVSAVKEEMK